ncbi:MAG TPA: alpha/beta fold hydrolase [Gemmatimonadaceae bacterium]|nr:alpha/beta fold hydrolase [Gemmatimonadaceae bacterium]
MRHDLTLSVHGYDIPAALEIPNGPPAGAVLLIPGSLFSNVDGDYPTWNMFPRVYAYLAEQMAERGLVVYRFAKNGPGTGTVETANAKPELIRNNWKGRATVAHAALAHFRAELAARGITVPHTVLAGHSEGAVVASVIARQGADVDGVVLLSGPSVGILGIMIEQSRSMLVPGSGEGPAVLLEKIVAHIRKGEPIPDELRAQSSGPFGAGALLSMPPEAVAYMRECDATDPVAEIANYEKPVLIVQGTIDASVPVHHSETLRDARGSRPTTYRVFEGLQHMYKPVPPGASPQEIFGLTGPTDPRVADAIDSFVRAL